MIETENLNSLVGQRDGLPAALDQELEAFDPDPVRIAEIESRRKALNLQIWSIRLANIKQTIKAKDRERIDVDHQLVSIEGSLTAAKQIYDERLVQLEAAYEVHAQLQLRAGILDGRKQTLFEDVSELKKELIELKRSRGNQNEN